MLIGRKLVVGGRHHRHDLVILADNEGDALDKAVADFDAANILGARLGFAWSSDYRTWRCEAFVRSDGEFSGAEIGIGGELVEPFQIVGRHADDAGAGGFELLMAFGEGMGFQIAAAGIGGRIEIDHGRALLQRFIQLEGEFLAAQAGDGAEKSGAMSPTLSAAKAGRGENGGQGQAQKQFLHDKSSP